MLCCCPIHIGKQEISFILLLYKEIAVSTICLVFVRTLLKFPIFIIKPLQGMIAPRVFSGAQIQDGGYSGFKRWRRTGKRLAIILQHTLFTQQLSEMQLIKNQMLRNFQYLRVLYRIITLFDANLQNRCRSLGNRRETPGL